MRKKGRCSVLELYIGRPVDGAGRLEKERRVYDLLDRLGIAYWRVDHEAVDTMEDCRAIDEALGIAICKNLFLCNRQKTAFYLLLMPGDKPFRTKELSAQIGSARLSFGSAEDMERLLDLTPGSVSVTGLMNDRAGAVQLLIDEELLGSEYFGCHPSINTSSIRLRTRDLLDVFLPAVGHAPVLVRLSGAADGCVKAENPVK